MWCERNASSNKWGVTRVIESGELRAKGRGLSQGETEPSRVLVTDHDVMLDGRDERGALMSRISMLAI
jgi:hypothetical protein